MRLLECTPNSRQLSFFTRPLVMGMPKHPITIPVIGMVIQTEAHTFLIRKEGR